MGTKHRASPPLQKVEGSVPVSTHRSTTMFRCVSNGVSKGVLDVLKSVYLSHWKVEVQRVTVVEFIMYDRSGDGVGCLEVKVGARCGRRTKQKIIHLKQNF